MAKTISEIAKELNISASTVSRVVNNKSYVNEKTRKKVLDALKKSDYIPNQLARSLKVQTTKTIGIVVPDICERFFGQIIKGIDAVVSSKGYSMILVDTDESKEKEAEYLKMLFQQRIAGLVIATVNIDGINIDQYSKHNIPVTFIDNMPNLDKPFNAVLIDNVLASRYAVRHFLEKGHKDIAIITGSTKETTGYDRLLGYQLALKDANVEINNNLIMQGNYKEPSGYKCMKKLIENKEKNSFTAVYVTSEMMTYGAIKAMKEYNLKFPEDIALIGFDVHDKTGLVRPEITTIRQPEHQIGKLTAEILLKQLEGKGEMPTEEQRQRTLLSPYLEEKESC